MKTLIKWLIKHWLKGYHLAKNPVRKTIEPLKEENNEARS